MRHMTRVILTLAFEIGDKDRAKGEKGQELIRYNVNGVVLDDAAFKKLSTEVHFKKLKAKSGDSEEVFYVGRYPDVAGKQRDLIVRRGKVGRYENDQIVEKAATNRFYYEVLPNSKFASQIAERAN